MRERRGELVRSPTCLSTFAEALLSAGTHTHTGYDQLMCFIRSNRTVFSSVAVRYISLQVAESHIVS